MAPLDLLGFAVGALRGHRLRTALSVAGVAIGIASVLALTALGEGARRYIVDEFASLGSNLVIILPGKVETTGGMPFGGVTHDLTLEDHAALARLGRLRRTVPLAVATETLRFQGLGRSVPVLGTTAEYLEVRRLRMAAGSFLPPGDPHRAGTEIVLGMKAARELFRGENPLGQVLRVGPARFHVVGVLAPRGPSMLGVDLDEAAFVPVGTAMRLFNRTSLFRIVAEVRIFAEMDLAKAEVLALLRERHRAEDVTVFTQDAMVASFSAILGALTLTLAGIASVSLVVAGVGIMNVMLVSVTERRAEIGLLKALGAADPQILLAFLAEATMLAALGGCLGLAAGAAGVRLLAWVYPAFPAAIPLWAVGAALTLSFAVGLGFGVWPARRATRLDPVAALARR
ncbi:ABC transporter permease [Geothrix rubra]|uniref:ABC transporter permease n=1 Tax=Geothrix rubra TaxID=2927977 RepID=A0ABQ5Q8I6_9BACT|nr:ABC transporter permease [Geothrix rubra]GLH71140.1 ABC transporter permease [Geothrix rubra]